MKLSIALIVLLGAALGAQTQPAAPAPTPSTVLATFEDGHKLTYGELRSILSVMAPQQQQKGMQNMKDLIHQLALWRKLGQMAESEKLDQRSPTREELEFNRTWILANAAMAHQLNNVALPSEELEKFYKENPDRYTQAKVKVLYVSFAVNPSAQSPTGKKYLSEPEAKARVEKILKEARGGADFVKLVKEYSDDKASQAKDGDFGSIRRTDNLPDEVRNAIFSLKTGQISEPVRQPNGFYLFRAEEVGPRPFDQVRDDVFNDLKQARFAKWMEQLDKSVAVTYENESLLQPQATR